METPQKIAEAAAPSWLTSLQMTAILRRGELAVSLILSLYGAIVVWILCSPMAAGTWAAAMLATQLFARIAFSRFEAINLARIPSRGDRFVCHAAMFLSNLGYSGVSVPLWFEGGPAGRIFAIVWLCGALVHATQHIHNDRDMLVTAILAHVTYFIGLPALEFVFGGELDRPGASLVLLAVALFGAHLVLAFRSSNAASALLRAAREQALERQAIAEAASESKSRFLAVMSHELRTPMNGVLGMTRLLLESELSHRQRQQAESLQDAGEMLLSILNDILDFSKIEAGAIKLETGEVDVRRLAASLTALWRARAEEKKLRLEAIIAPDAPALVSADGLRLRQIVSNLLSNAVKFTDDGEVRLEISAEKLRNDGARLRISVVDTGCGVAPEHLTRLFEAFEQVDSSATRRFGGAGLGLAIARRLARLMGGEVGVVSEIGVGSRFSFEADLPVLEWIPAATVLDVDPDDRGEVESEAEDPDIEFEDVTGFEPIDAIDDRRMDTPERDVEDDAHSQRDALLYAAPAKPEAAKPRTEKPPESAVVRAGSPTASRSAATPDRAGAGAAAGKRLQVCIVEDQALNRRVIEAALVRLNCDLTFAIDGREALERLQAQRFDLIFMDLQMPVHDGFEVTRRIRKGDGVNACTPIIGLTANVLDGVRESCIAAGMNDFVSKPLDLRLLYQVVERVLTARGEPAEDRRLA
jgi:signal transduction histidine kinase/ActR/RegA family two-component response regulator